MPVAMEISKLQHFCGKVALPLWQFVISLGEVSELIRSRRLQQMTSYNLHINFLVENMHTSVQHSTTYIAMCLNNRKLCVYKQVMKHSV